ncbi:SGF29 tudor-like domain-containing protein [Mycotypha africana]|uniref:SGF29 tudor-like domain-containing protein n=1 Tax=Mycotypha africana TaxID=64632 RepID=UPI00230098E8|nr:SGF29 tudor-like domain-containing protein [Mycotypha africana]KAI8971915.1 SGF29 tudor-like domain-containing protein [Mycotypha africana]
MDRKSRTSRSATLEETNEEVSLWKQICNSLSKLENVQENITTIVTSINHLHTTVNTEDGVPPRIGDKLTEYYKGGIDLTQHEAKTINDIIEKLSVLIALRDASEYSYGNGVLAFGTSVAAKQPKQKDKNEEWILAVVLNYNNEKNKYEVEDVDQDEFGQKQRYLLQPRNVIPIPSAEEAKSMLEFNSGQDVLALYPGTTCFYRAKVIASPSKVSRDALFEHHGLTVI